MLFPPNSGDINPIETVWARLRKDLAIQEFEDLKNDKVITVASFRKRVAQLLRSYSTPGAPFFFIFILIPFVFILFVLACIAIFIRIRILSLFLNAAKALESSIVTWRGWFVAFPRG